LKLSFFLATSGLDAESEHAVSAAINQVTTGRTVLIISHRLKTVMGADKILVFSEGKVIEEGTHEQLMEKHGMYENLVKKQTLES